MKNPLHSLERSRDFSRQFGGYDGLFQAVSEVTRILTAIEQGDPSAAEQLLPLV